MKAERIPAVHDDSLIAMFMKKSALLVLLMLAAGIVSAQSAPSLENGFKHFGSYDFHDLDSVNVMNGNLMLHVPLIADVPQRGQSGLHPSLYVTSKDWQAACQPDSSTPTGEVCNWRKGGTGATLVYSRAILVQRTVEMIGSGTGTLQYKHYGYTVQTSDAATHQVQGAAGTLDATGEPTQFDSVDSSGFHLVLSSADANQIPDTFTITDRQGNLYQGTFTGYGTCANVVGNQPPPVGLGGSGGGQIQPIIDDAPFGSRYCSQSANAVLVTDRNGNRITFPGPNATAQDTLGRPLPLLFPGDGVTTNDSSGCASHFTFYGSVYAHYKAPDGSTQLIKLCYSDIPIHTAFNSTSTAGTPIFELDSVRDALHFYYLTTLVLADGRTWNFDYDSYGELISVGLPTGGSIAYTWATISYANCDPTSNTRVSRAVITRTLNDGRGGSYAWQYHWGAPSSTGQVNTVTDALGNDSVHVFTALTDPDNTSGSCNLYETRTLEYQGRSASGVLLQKVDTTYSFNVMGADGANLSGGVVGNVFATDIVTTVYPSGKLKKVHKDPDVVNGIVYGNTAKELVYDWGPGQPGPLLREVDTTYQWQVDSRYLDAGLVDLPYSVVVKDGSGCVLSKTTYGYDENGYSQTYPGTLPTGTHAGPPHAVRGNQTSVNHYLWNLGSGACAAVPSSPAIVSHNVWYDTGELYQQIDPLGHTTTHNYDPAYGGAYSTQTCNALNQCVSGTYDFNTGVLTSFTDANGSYAASGSTPGDPAHTSNYSYDFLFRLTTALAPPDPLNGGARPQTSFAFSAPGAFPLSVQEQKSITSTTIDISTAYFDGLARPYQTQHVTPSGTAKVDTTYDGLSQVTAVSNPYFNQTDSTYGVVQTVYDALGRATQTTKQDGSLAAADYSSGDNCVISSDEAGKQRRACSDALGRLTSVDEPGDSSSSASPVLAPGTHASGTVTITGADQSATGNDTGSGGTSGTVRCPPRLICDDSGGGGGGSTTTIYDFGTVSITINQRVYTVNFDVRDNPTTIAANLAAAINADQSLGVTASSSAGTVSLTSISASSAGSFTLSTSYTWDSTHFAQPSFTSSVTSITGGTDGSVFGGHAYTTLYTYDALGNLLQVTQQGGTSTQSLWRVRNFTYDSLGRLLTANNPESGTITYQYDNDGNLTSKTDARGLATSYAYDALHRVTGKSYSDNSPALVYVYDHLPWYANSNPVGRLVEIYNSANHAAVYDYDVFGRIVFQQESDPSTNTSLGATRAAYDLAGNLTALTYPSGRKVTFNYNSGNQLDQVQFASWNGAQVGTSYWSASDTNFSPMGSPNSWTLGNGVTESAVFNKRLQLQEETVTNPAIHTLMDHAFSYGAQGANNGNVMSVADQLNPARTQSFTYDALNRLATANESGGRWGLGFVYDPWGNRLQQNVTVGVAGTSQLNVDNRNRITGAPANCTAANAYCYDAAGDLLNDGFHQYAYDAESQIKQVDGGAATYSYDAAGQRVRKQTASGSTQYLYFGGNIIAEKNLTTGDWTDYIFAGGKRVAQAFSNENRIRIYGTNTCTDCTGGWASFSFPVNNDLSSYVIKAGDKLFVRQTAIGNVHSGVGLIFSDGTNCGTLADQDGQPVYNDAQGQNGAWHYRTIDLSAMQGKSLTLVYLSAIPTGSGNWSGYFNDIAIVSSDGTVFPVFAQNDTVTFSNSGHSSGISTIGYELNRDSTAATYPFSVHYYHGDQIGSSRLMTSAQGWPIWQGTFLPFGEEYNPQVSSNHYKFTGKERDTESGLDYFGARYYGSALGRFISSDWSAVAVPVPYADFSDPQSLNLYSYVRNIPSIRVDPDGHCCDWVDSVGNFVSAGLNAWGSDNLLGAGRMEQTTTSGKVGQFFGDLGATIQGGLETTASVGGELLGLGMDGTVVLAPEGLAVNVLSTAGIIHGQATTATAGKNLMKAVTDWNTRSQSFNEAKRDANVPTSQQPDKTTKAPLTDSKGKPVIDTKTGKPIQTREYTYTNSEGKTVTIQDHAQGHEFNDGASVGPHFNVRDGSGPTMDRNKPAPGTQTHYPYEPK